MVMELTHHRRSIRCVGGASRGPAGIVDVQDRRQLSNCRAYSSVLASRAHATRWRDCSSSPASYRNWDGPEVSRPPRVATWVRIRVSFARVAAT